MGKNKRSKRKRKHLNIIPDLTITRGTPENEWETGESRGRVSQTNQPHFKLSPRRNTSDRGSCSQVIPPWPGTSKAAEPEPSTWTGGTTSLGFSSGDYKRRTGSSSTGRLHGGRGQECDDGPQRRAGACSSVFFEMVSSFLPTGSRREWASPSASDQRSHAPGPFPRDARSGGKARGWQSRSGRIDVSSRPMPERFFRESPGRVPRPIFRGKPPSQEREYGGSSSQPEVPYCAEDAVRPERRSLTEDRSRPRFQEYQSRRSNARRFAKGNEGQGNDFLTAQSWKRRRSHDLSPSPGMHQTRKKMPQATEEDLRLTYPHNQIPCDRNKAQGHSPFCKKRQRSRSQSPKRSTWKRRKMGTRQGQIFEDFKKRFWALDAESADTAAVFLGSNGDDFRMFLEQAQGKGNIKGIVHMLRKVVDVSMCPTNKVSLYEVLTGDVKFFEREPVIEVLRGILNLAKLGQTPDESNTAFISDLVTLLHDVAKTSDDFAKDADTLISVYIIGDIVRRFEGNSDIGTDILRGMLDGISELQRRAVADVCTKVSTIDKEAFRILPCPDEMMTERYLDIEPHEPSRCFSSSKDYLRYMFRIFREDFVTPLCSGVREYVERLRQGQPPQSGRLKEVRAFRNVVFTSLKALFRSGVVWTIQLDLQTTHRRLMSSGAFKHRSLLCLSKDDFQTLFFAEVAQTTLRDLRQGHLEIRILDECVRVDMELLFSSTFVVLESTAFFTAYNFTLQSLRAMATAEAEGRQLPMAEYFVEGRFKPEKPSYLQVDSVIDLSCLEDGATQGSQASKPRSRTIPPNGMEQEDASVEDRGHRDRRLKKVPVLQKELWPSCQTLGLDASQSEALRLAVSGELALIQGPPGTGKTTLGVKLTQVLLANGRLWRGEQPRPLLLLSYTNHALDQFLQLLLQTPGMGRVRSTDIVRVGGGCKDPSLQRFTLTAHRESGTGDVQDHPAALRNMRRHSAKFRNRISRLDQAQSGLVHEDALRNEECSLASHYATLQQTFSSDQPDNKTILVEWLDLIEEAKKSQEAGDAAEEENDRMEEEFQEDYMERRVEGFDDDDRHGDNQTSSVVAKNFMAVDGGILLNEDEFWCTKPTKLRMEVIALVTRSLRVHDKMSKEEEEAVSDVWELGLAERWRLYRLWHWRLVVRLGQDLEPAIEGVTRAAARLGEADALRDLAILSEARLVAMTTTGAARCSALLQQLAPPVVLVEEAAEIPEQHVLAALTPDCRHLVLIGDHCQLRPKPNAHALARTFHTDVSMFERLVRAGVQHCSLSVQHRMRPEISKLMVPHFYAHLQDHASVRSYPHVRGMKEDLFFLEHSHPETKREGSTSVCNHFEADFIAQLYRYLRLQGYSTEDMIILATYQDQVRLIRRYIRTMERDDPRLQSAQRLAATALAARETEGESHGEDRPGEDEGVRVTTVDNFQGEEARIILLSLVRSNTDNSVGHLAAPNRTCVALSRAREGMYVVGNLSLLRRCSPVWRKLCLTATQHHQLGASLTLVCRRHLRHATHVTSSNDFSKVPDGGCHLPCVVRRPCGHACERHCHHDDPDHVAPCPKPCPRTCSKGHPCPKPCSQYCGPCMHPEPVILPLCRHEQSVPCSTSVQDFDCQARCRRMLKCGHQCQNRCSAWCTLPGGCNELTKVELECGHITQVACRAKEDAACPVPCKAKLDCGHPCTGTCGTCFQGRLHVACRKPCARKLVCGHICTGKCCQACPPCQKKCPRACSHSRCPKRCGEACAPCLEPCSWRCSPDCDQALQCPRLCGEVCQRPRCSRPCLKKLACRHPCRGLRCEPCPPCPRCVPSLREIFFGAEDDPMALFYTLPDCRHTFEVTSLDAYVTSEQDSEDIGPILCPKCTTPILKSDRYGDVIKQAQDSIECVKKKIVELSGMAPARLSALEEKVWRCWISEGMPVGMKDELFGRLRSKTAKNLSYYGALENQINFATSLNRLNEKLDECVDVTGEDEDEDEDGLKENAASARRLRKTLRRLAVWSLAPRYHLSEQSLREFQAEFLRLELLVDLLRLQASLLTTYRDRVSAQDSQDVGRWLRKLEVRGGRGPTGVELAEAGKHLRRLQETFPPPGLGVSEAERLQIVRAMGFARKGHWYKCPTGHVYAIGDCGGAMQQAACPECGAAIGGGSHRLVEDNALASEMDGAQFPAWSEQANLNNYVMHA